MRERNNSDEAVAGDPRLVNRTVRPRKWSSAQYDLVDRVQASQHYAGGVQIRIKSEAERSLSGSCSKSPASTEVATASS